VFKSKLRRVTPDFQATYPDFQLEDELFPEDGRDVMTGQVYKRRRKERG